MSEKIIIDLNNLTQAINQLNDYADSIEENADKLVKRLSDIAYQEAFDDYGLYEGIDAPARVDPPVLNEDRNGYKIIASGDPVTGEDGNAVGNTVTFVEFGSGNAAGDHPMASEFGIAPGTWSSSPYGSHQYSSQKWWKYRGKVYDSISPTMGMYNGATEARRKLVQTAKEIFGGNGNG